MNEMPFQPLEIQPGMQSVALRDAFVLNEANGRVVSYLEEQYEGELMLTPVTTDGMLLSRGRVFGMVTTESLAAVLIGMCYALLAQEPFSKEDCNV